MSILIEPAGVDCLIIEVRRIHICEAWKLRATINNEEGDRYTKEEMEHWGFVAKEAE